MAIKITWLSAGTSTDRQERTRFLASVHDLVKDFPEQCVATAIPFGTDGKLIMLHVVAGSKNGELIQFSAALIQEFETLAARLITELSQSELEVAQDALEAREIGALTAASHEELAVVVGRPNVGRAQEQIGNLLRTYSA